MAMERMVRAGILDSDKVNSLNWGAEVFFRRLMSVADDFGRYDGRINMLRANCYPTKLDQVSGADVGKWLHECCTAGLVSVYEVKGKQYVVIHEFRQRLRSKKSKYPDPKEADDIVSDTSRTNVSTLRTNALEVEVEEEVEGEDEGEGEDAQARTPPPTNSETIPLSVYEQMQKAGSAPKPKEEIPPDSAAPPFVDFSKTRLPIERLKELYLKDQIGAEAVCMSYSWGNIEMLDAWLDAFNHWRKQQGETSDNQKNYRNHFLAWIRKQPNQEDPKTLNNQNRKHGKNDNGPPKNTVNAFSAISNKIRDQV